MIKAGIIGMGVGEKHFEAINNYRGCKVVSISNYTSVLYTLLDLKI